MEDLQSQIDDIDARLDNIESDQQDFSDNFDQSSEDIQSNLDEITQNISDLQENSGQLSFPLTQDTSTLIKQVFPTGSGTLVAGAVTLEDPNIGPNSNIQITVQTAGGTQGFLTYIPTTGSFTVNSSSTTDTSTFNYVVYS